ncbi:MAG: tRNA guanosine(34) transglycosylase Tgt [Bifidobacteriaceae bacterium]|jgi:queuine tRNA-ribosyltransferase|nr:tRNA guanosine(34) transglycosylase Tgt [Bifidobacteriaceae bacterium]
MLDAKLEVNKKNGFSFEIISEYENKKTKQITRAGIIHTPHGDIKTPAFIPVATLGTLKALTPEMAEGLGSQALLANAYHLNLRPGPDVIDKAGGLSKYMNWNHPTFTDSGGFQVMSLGSGFKKVIEMDPQKIASQSDFEAADDEKVANGKKRIAFVDEDGVTFKSHLSGEELRFTPEVSMEIQFKIAADIIFAFDELTTLHNTRKYQEQSVARTFRWAKRCIDEHEKLKNSHPEKPYQALFGVIQGANHEDLRRKAAGQIGPLPFDGFGIGGALEKSKLSEIIGWVTDELPKNLPRHLLGISEIDDLFAGVNAGIDTFDCVSPARIGRNGAVYTPYGRFNIKRSKYLEDFGPIFHDCKCYTCTNFSRSYVCHLIRAKEMLGSTLATIHNEHFIVKLISDCRDAIINKDLEVFTDSFLHQYLGKRVSQ